MTPSHLESAPQRPVQEKTAWMSLLTTLALYVPYFAFVWPELLAGTATIGPALVLLIVVQAVLLPLSLWVWRRLEGGPEGALTDERDRAIALRATRTSYVVLAGLGFTWGSVLLLPGGAALAVPGTLLHVALLSFVLAEVAGNIVSLWSYHRGG